MSDPWGPESIPRPLEAARAWSDHNPIRWGPCPTIDACTKANRCPLRDADDEEIAKYRRTK